VTDNADPETLELCRQLCTRAGMLFEDASAKAVLIGHLQSDELGARIKEVRCMARQASSLLDAANELTSS